MSPRRFAARKVFSSMPSSLAAWFAGIVALAENARSSRRSVAGPRFS